MASLSCLNWDPPLNMADTLTKEMLPALIRLNSGLKSILTTVSL